MPRLDLTAGEAKQLQHVLESHLSDLRMEIAGTDSFDLRRRLKRTEVFLKRLIAHLQNRPQARKPR